MQFIIQKKSFILSVIFLIFCFFIFFFLYKNVDSNEKKLQLTQEKWQAEVTRIENTKSLINSIKAVEPERILLETHFIRSSNVVPLLDMIEKLSREVGTKTEVISVDITKDNPSLIVKAKASGGFGAIYKLITLLENSAYNLEFISVDIQNSSARAWTAVFQVKLLNFIN